MGAKSFSGSNGIDEYSAGFTARFAVCPIAMVYPSGGDLAAASRPMLPPAPGRFSTTIVHFVSVAIDCAMARESVSVPPAGGNGTMSLMSFPG
jgi:hypothetical protein